MFTTSVGPGPWYYLSLISRYLLMSWASAHKGKWGQLTPLGKMGEKLKSENMQKRAVF